MIYPRRSADGDRHLVMAIERHRQPREDQRGLPLPRPVHLLCTCSPRSTKPCGPACPRCDPEGGLQ